MYVCGITPYDSTHLGHAATYLAYDLLTRRLMELGHEVRMVRNVTDVDDSILPRRAGVAGALRGRPPRLARGVLRDGDAGARADARSARRRHRPDLPASRERDRPERVPHRQAVRAALDALGDGVLRGREDEQVARQPRVRERPAEGGRSEGDQADPDAPPLPGRFR